MCSTISNRSVSKYSVKKYFDDCLIKVENALKTDGLTNNIQLNKLGKKLFGDRYKGTVMSDQIPMLKNGEMCIINTDPSSKKGMHWIALYSFNNRKYFYDSFGRDYKKLSPNFKHKRWVIVHDSVDEADSAKDCGQISMAFLMTFDKYKIKCINII
jgi:hypothetical protein